MNEYRESYSRLAMGCTAIAITAVVIGLAVIVPAQMHGRSFEAPAAQTAVAPGSIEADILPARIEVFGIRDPKVISMQPSVAQQAAREQG